MLKIIRWLTLPLLVFPFSYSSGKVASELNVNNIAESYVKLVLEVGLYDPDYVDTYYGPPEWRPSKDETRTEEKFPYDQLREKVNQIIKQLGKIDQNQFGGLEKLRYVFLMEQLSSVKARIDLLSGKRMSFDEESKALYGAVAPTYDEDYFQNILKKLDNALPGEGDIYERFINYRKEFIIPKDKLDAVFKAAIDECRRRTLKYIELPENENVILEFVTDKPWVAYNWYKGNSFSLIQVNEDWLIHIDWGIGLASHEGYPGHHVNMTLLEKHLVKDMNWMEFSVSPLCSPQTLIAEGIAEYATIDLLFPGSERVEFERKVLFPLAGLDPLKAEKYYEIIKLWDEVIRYRAEIEAARRYLDGKISKEETIAWVKKYCLCTPVEAELTVRALEVGRSYIINYSLGYDLIKNYIEKRGGTDENLQKRWALFHTLLSAPPTVSSLQ